MTRTCRAALLMLMFVGVCPAGAWAQQSGTVFGLVAGAANIVAGYAFTSFAMQTAFEKAYRDARGADRVTSNVSNMLVLKPEASAWIDISPKVGLNVSLGYMAARPSITLTTGAGRDRYPIRADVVMFKVGAV